MSDVQFEEDNDMASFKSHKILGEAQVPQIIKFLMKKGVTKSAKQSYYLLLGSVIVFILVAIFVYVYFVLGVGSPHKTEFKIPLELKMQLEASKLDSGTVQ